jgi:hypothetical protein
MPVYRNPDFRRLPAGAAAIFAAAQDDSFFALPGWYDLMARHGLPAGAETRLYTHEGPGGAALVLRTEGETGRGLASLADVYSVEHGLLHAPGADLAAGLDAILGDILAERPRAGRLLLGALDPGDPGFTALVGSLRRSGFFVECVFQFGTWYEATEGMSFADYLAARPSELRNTWRRKQRRLGRDNRVAKSWIAGGDGLDRAIDDYEAIYARSWKPPEGYPGFVPALIRCAAEIGALRLGLYYIDGIPAAAQLWTVWRGRAVIHKLAHDKRFDDLSLGTILTMEMTERALAEDRPREISLGIGDDPYKKLWLPRRRERWGIRAANPRTFDGLAFGLKREAAKIYHRLRGERVTPAG